MTKRSKAKKPSGWLDLGSIFRPQVIGIGFLLAGIVTLLTLIPGQRGSMMGPWIKLLQQAVGLGAWLMPVVFIALGIWLIRLGLGRNSDSAWEDLVGAAILFVSGLAFLHLLAGGDEPRALAVEGGGGGYLGYAISHLLVSWFGDLAAGIILAALLLVGLIIILPMSLSEMGQAIAGAIQQFRDRPRLPAVNLNNGKNGKPVASAPRLPEAEAESAPAAASLRGSIFPRILGGDQVWRLPPVSEILEEATEQELSQFEIRERVKIIEETLASFGVPAKVVEVNQGPSITQFGVEPGYIERRDTNGRASRAKIKVSKIANLSDDLSLALAASPIRIEAPVPGRSMVGIEVPNSEIALVALRTVLDSDLFQKIKGPLPIALGQDVAGVPYATDLAGMPHLLIAGATGSGKSVCVNAIIASLLCTRTPDEVQFIMIDPKMVELTAYNGVPHLRAPVVIELERVVGVLNWATREMESRYKQFNRARARNIEAYNQMLVQKRDKPLPYIVVVIDELADLMMAAPDEVERSICRIAQMARATGIHLVIATQRPSVDVVTGLIKANFPARISFAVTSQVDSRVIIDTTGAEKLLGRGDMLFMAPDSSKLARLQGCYVSDKELSALVRYWKGMRLVEEPARSGEAVQQSMWDEIEAKSEPAAGGDELLPKAIAIVQEDKRASISMLQRRLRIGYSRAARLIEEMEKRGLIGPEQEGGRPREVLVGGAAAEEAEEDDLPPL